MCGNAIVVFVGLVGIHCSVVLVVIGFLMGIVAVCFWWCCGRLVSNQLKALGDINPMEMGWWTEGREKGCQSGLFALCVFEIAIVVDVASRIVFCHMRAPGYQGREIRCQSANTM